MNARTDIHRPSAPEFDPESYVCLGVFDTHPESGEGRARAAVISGQRAQGRRFAPHTGGQHICGHCGHALRYVALMLHEVAGELIYVGQDCLSNRFEELTRGEFQALREAAALNRKREALAVRRAEFVAAHPELVELTYLDNFAGAVPEFLYSIAGQLHSKGELSERQVSTAVRVLTEVNAKAAVREAERIAKEAAKASGEIEAAPSGKVVVTGEVLSSRFVSNPHGPGGSLKGRIRDDRGFTVWVTIPRAIEDKVEDGTRVTLTATLTPADDDPHHAWGARPSRASVLA